MVVAATSEATAVEAVPSVANRDAARVVVGFDYRVIDVLVRLAPSWTLALVARFGRNFPPTGTRR